MSYTAPSVDASSQTFADLQSKGLSGMVDGLIAAQDPAMTAAAVSYTHQLLTINQASLVAERAKQLVDSYLHGDPVLIATLKTEIFDLQYAFAVIHKTLGEIGVLVDANPGTLTFGPNLLTGKTIRTFP